MTSVANETSPATSTLHSGHLTNLCHLSSLEIRSHFRNTSSTWDNDNLDPQELSQVTIQMCNQALFEKWISIIVPIVFAMIVLVGIVGNLLVLIVVLFKQQMRNTTNVLIVVSTI